MKKKPYVEVLVCEKNCSTSVFLKFSHYINGMLCRLLECSYELWMRDTIRKFMKKTSFVNEDHLT